MIRLYAGARALALESPTHRKEYSQKADDQFRNLARWFREQFIRHLDVTYQGHTETVRQVFARLQSSASLDTADLLSKVAAYFLEAEFEERYPDYPRFSGLREPMSEEGRKPNASEAIRALAGRARTQLVTSILQGLELLDEQGVIRPQKSRYAQRFLEFLTSRPEGQVVNRSDLIEIVAPGIQPVEKDRFFHLEPEWVAVLLVALVYAGDIELGLANGKTLDAGTLEDAATLPLEELTGFRLMRRPSALPVSLWAAIFEGLGLRPRLIRDP
ncbi:MAG: hypothetical protein H5T71_02540, partial [Chloroflexi bacterium]|nr:hypothetical protein [Chloroflexota bacterium]